MRDLPSITIDAGVLAVPPPASNTNHAHQYIDTLLHWSTLLDKPWIAIYMSERASESLVTDGLYPLRDHLGKLFTAHGIVEYDVNTVARVIDRLLTITPSFETYYNVKDVLADNIETNPDVIRLTTFGGLQSDLARCIILIAILRKHCVQPLGGHSLILRKAPRQTIQVKAQIHDLEHGRTDIPALPVPPSFFEGDVLACDNFKGLIECLDASTILVGASDNLGIEIAIRIALFKRAVERGENPEWTDILVPRIGKKFKETCQQCCADKGDSLPPKILRSIVETVNGENMPDVHALRTGTGGGDPPRMRGNDKAQRRDIDREFHLHYWDCDDEAIELASVVYHNDFSIPG